MLALFKTHRNLILAAALLVVAFVAYTLFFRGGEPAPSSPLLVERPENIVGQDLVALLLRLQSIRLDQSLLGNPLFRSLRDFGREIPPEPVGRENHFVPF